MNNTTREYRIKSPLFTTSAISPKYLRDTPQETSKQNLAFHIEKGDYFGTLATVMGLIADALGSDNEAAKRRCIETVADLRDDLVYLQNTHQIVRKG